MNTTKQHQEYWTNFFIIWFLTDSLFNHTIIGMIGQVLFMLYSIYICFINKTIHSSVLFFIYGLFCTVCYLNIILGHAVDPNRSRFMLGVVLRNFVFIYCLYQYISNTTANTFIPIFVKVCCISSIGILIVNYARTGVIYMHEDDLLEKMINANMQSVINAFAASWMIINKRYKGRELIILIVLLIFIILSGTRKSIISIAIIVGGFTILKSSRHRIRNLLGIVVLFFISYLVIMRIPSIYEMIGSRLESLFAFMNGEESDASTNTRNRFIVLGMSFWSQEPIWGNGLNSFGLLWGDETTYCHNNYVELLCCVGLMGCISYYLMFLIPLIRSIAIYVKTHNSKALLSLCLILSILVSDYAMVTYFERMPYIELLLVYVLINESRPWAKRILI